MRVHELAKDLDVSVEELIEILGDVDIAAEDETSTLSDAEVAVVCDELGFASIEEARAANTETPAEPETVEEPPAETEEPAAVPETEAAAPEEEQAAADDTIILPKATVVVKDLAKRLGLKPNQLIAELMRMNIFASINKEIDLKTAQQIGEKHGRKIEQKKKEKPTPKKEVDAKKERLEEEEKDRPEDLVLRPPVVTFMGHVDHGKTSLLDRIRDTKVVKGESGGITQHIGAYTVEVGDHKITFLDTPGHAAFTAMRARGANMTDLVVLVVAAEDGVMPQTIEAIQHAKAAKVCLLVAMNKMDLPAANPDRLKQQLQEHELMVEDWGGSIGCCPVSAETGDGIEELLERIALESEMLELKANPHKRARGYVIEAQMEPGMGPTATLLVTDGTLKVGDNVLCGAHWGRIKALINHEGKKVRTASPSFAVKCIGLTGVPGAGDEFNVYASDREAKQLSEEMLAEIKIAELSDQGPQRKLSLNDLFAAAESAEVKELPLIIKCDVQGSVEAIQHSLEGIQSDKVKLNILTNDVGNITTNDILLASASNAIILGFHVSKESGVTATVRKEGVEIRLYSIIYELIEEVEAAMRGLLEPELKETWQGEAEIRAIFQVGKNARIAGCMVTKGKITSRASIRIKRKDDVLYEGTLGSLKRFQNDASEVREGQECGIRPDNFSKFEEGDLIEAYTIDKIAQKL